MTQPISAPAQAPIPCLPNIVRGHLSQAQALAQDRAAIRGGAQAWAKTHAERDALDLGWAKANEAVFIVMVGVKDGAADRIELCHAYPMDAVLALGGKGRAKKALLELSSRAGVASPWFGIACKRILAGTLGRVSFNLHGPSAAALDAMFAESALSDMAQPSVELAGSGIALSSAAVCRRAGAVPALRAALSMALGEECFDLMPGLLATGQRGYCHSAPRSAIEQAMHWSKSRAASIAIQGSCSAAGSEAEAPARKPRL